MRSLYALLSRDQTKEAHIFQLRKARIEGYKALDPIELTIPGKLLFLIGSNGAGKSSALQALAFIQFLAQGDPFSFFQERNWAQTDVRSRSAGHNTLRYSLTLHDPNDDVRVVWQLMWGVNSGSLVNERFWTSSPGRAPREVFTFNRRDGFRSEAGSEFKGLTPKGSMLTMVDKGAISTEPEVLNRTIDWALRITSLELLSPVAMRGSTRGTTKGIGVRGQSLAGFLAALDSKTREKIVARLSDFYPLESLSTIRKRAGWVDLKIAESYGIGNIGASHVSDGFLRLLALSAIPEFGHRSSLVLLDEIEDGIEPHILPRIIERLVKDSNSQFVMTSHSPLLINFFSPEDVSLVSRTPDGHSAMTRLIDLKVIQEGSEYLGSGEIWANTGLATLNEQTPDQSIAESSAVFSAEGAETEINRP